MQLLATHQVETSGFDDTTRATIKADGAMFDILATKLYSDPILAVVREYVCNALDITGPDTPAFKVSLPHLAGGGDPQFIVRDYGPGLTPEQMIELFINFGGSSKRDENTSVGGFGIGCKSGFAYADAFVVSSYQDGLKRSYCFFRGADRIPQLTTPEVTATDEPNGVEIMIPVQRKDRDAFINRASEFMRFVPRDKFETFGFQPFAADFEQVDGFLILGADKGYKHWVKVGPVLYTLDWNQITGATELPRTIVPDLSIGSLDIAPNRESLTYSDRTKVALKAANRRIVDNLARKMQVEWRAASKLEKLKLAEDYSQRGLSGIARDAIPDFAFQIKLSFEVWDTPNVWIRLAKMPLEGFHKFSYREAKNLRFILDDLEGDPKRRLQARLNENFNGGKFVILPKSRFMNMAGAMKYMDGFPADRFYLLSELNPPERAYVAPREKRASIRVLRVTETETTDKGDRLEGGVYVPTSNYELENPADRDLLKTRWAKTLTVYGLSKAARKAIPSHQQGDFVHLRDKLLQLHAEALAKPRTQEVFDYLATLRVINDDEVLRLRWKILSTRHDRWASLSKHCEPLAEFARKAPRVEDYVDQIADFASRGMGKLPKGRVQKRVIAAINRAFDRSALLRLLEGVSTGAATEISRNDALLKELI